MKYQAINDEVLYTTENITKINSADIDQLKVLSKTCLLYTSDAADE